MGRPAFRRPIADGLAALSGLALGLLLYAASPGAANAGDLGEADRVALRALGTGHMDKLVVHESPRDPIGASFIGPAGEDRSLAEFRGKVVLVNFWATWCPPCRAEMPSIDRLAGALGQTEFAVLALSTDFGTIDKPAGFFEEIGVQNLAVYHDANKSVARAAAVLGLPVTLLLDREGREVARLVGDAEWDSAEAIAVMRKLAELTAPSG